MQREMIRQRDAGDEAHELVKTIRPPTGDGQREIQLRMSGFDKHPRTMIRRAGGGEANQRRSGPRVRLAVHLAQFRDTEVRVDLRGGKRSVAELFLHEAQVRAIGKQMRRAGVAELVRRQIGG